VELGLGPEPAGVRPSFARGSLPSYLVHGALPSHQTVLEVLAFHLEWEVAVFAPSYQLAIHDLAVVAPSYRYA